MPSLIDVQQYYEKNIKGNRYIYHSHNSLKLEFEITPERFCHLIFGTIPSQTPDAKKYKGKTGYDNISNGIITNANLPIAIRKHANDRTNEFINIHNLLDKPSSAYFFNDLIIVKGKSLKINKTDLNGDFLIFKRTTDYLLHLVLKNINVQGTARPVTISFFARKTSITDAEIYIKSQKSLKIEKIEKLKTT